MKRIGGVIGILLVALGIALVVSPGLAAESDPVAALAERVTELESRLNILELRLGALTKRAIFEERPALKSATDSAVFGHPGRNHPRKDVPVASRAHVAQQGERPTSKSYKLSELLPIPTRASKELKGCTVLGEVWIIDMDVAPDPSMTRFVGVYPADPAQYKEEIVCILDMPADTGLRIKQSDVWRIQGIVENAAVEKGGETTFLRLHLSAVHGTRTRRIDLGPGSVGTFRHKELFQRQ